MTSKNVEGLLERTRFRAALPVVDEVVVVVVELTDSPSFLDGEEVASEMW